MKIDNIKELNAMAVAILDEANMMDDMYRSDGERVKLIVDCAQKIVDGLKAELDESTFLELRRAADAVTAAAGVST